MEVKVKHKDKSVIEINCEMDWQEFKPYRDRAFELLKRDIEVRGFRHDKAPNDLLESKIGPEKINSLAAESIIKEKYLELIKEKGIEPIGPPQASVLKLAQDNPFSFKVTVYILPDVDLLDYKKIAKETPKEEAIVDDKEFDEAMKFLQRSRAKFEDLDRPCKKGDFVHIEYQSPQVDSNRKVSDGFVLGEGRLIKGFEEKLEGMKAGESKEFKEEFPKDYQSKNLAGPSASLREALRAGKEVEFKVKMEKVQKMIMPLLDDGFAQGLGKFKTIDELKKNVREGITKEKQQYKKEEWRDKVLDEIVKQTKVELPDILVRAEQENAIHQLKSRVQNDLKISFEEYLEQVKKKEEDIKKDLLEQAEFKVKNFLIIREIGKREKITVSAQEVEQAVNNFLTSFPQDAKKDLDKESLKGYYKEMMYTQKVFRKLEVFSI